jgi:hypothetical protein
MMTTTTAPHAPSLGKAAAALRPVPLTSVRLTDRFWSPRIEVNRTVTLPAQYQQCEQTGRVEALKLQWKPGTEPVPHIFWDSDLAKWLEAAAYSLAATADVELEARCDHVIDLLASMQAPDGYLNSHFQQVAPDKRWTNLRDAHELYCAGHLIEAAVAYYRTTGKRKVLDVLSRYVEHIAATFGTAAGQKRGYCGHEEIELALVKLYHATGDARHLALARYFVDERGRRDPEHFFDVEAKARSEDPDKFWAKTYEYNQSHQPVREQRHVVGHAVRAMYLYSAMADLAAEDGDDALAAACRALWDDLTLRKMYVTGGIGPSRHNEGFTADFDLPNLTAYAETCAAIGLVFWASRMLRVDLNGRYADVMEQALFNGVLSGVSLDGTRFFYENPLASVGKHRRQAWFSCACCPPNLSRLLASLGGYLYHQTDSALAVHLYAAGTAKVQIGGTDVELTQATDYPWDGRVTLTLKPATPARFELKLRIPGWCHGATINVGGELLAARPEQGYVTIDRTWAAGDVVELDLPLPIERVYADPQVRADVGRVAVRRGPIVYCAEAIDNGGAVEAFALPRNATLSPVPEPELLGGVVTIQADGAIWSDTTPWASELYRSSPPARRTTVLKLIPYYAWDNREPGEMAVWLREA